MDCKLRTFSKILPSNLFKTSDYSDFDSNSQHSSADLETKCYLKKRSLLSQNLDDLLYVDDLTDEDLISCLLFRYLNKKHFTYFGKVLLYIRPLDKDLLGDYSQFLYSDQSSDCHLFPFLRDIFRSFLKEPVKPDHVKQLNYSFVESFYYESVPQSPECDVNYNIFFYGDKNFGQLQTTQKSLLYLTNVVQSLSLEPTGTLTFKVSKALKLLEQLSDFSSNSNLCNYMVSYKMNFDKETHLTSVELIPNFSTDLSCSVLSCSFRQFLELNTTTSFPSLNIRFPSLFYGLLYSITESKNLKWFSNAKITPAVAAEILEHIPKHEVTDPSYHFLKFSELIDLLLLVGFTLDEIKYINTLVTSVLLFYLYSKLNHSQSFHYYSSLDYIKYLSDEESSIDPQSLNVPGILGSDLLSVILELLEIDVLTRPNSGLNYSDVLFKFELSNSTTQIFDNISSAIFLRLKHMVYCKLNEYLKVGSNDHTRKSLSLHCNSGFNPYSNFVNFTDYHLAWYSSEEFFLNKIFKSFTSLNDDQSLDFVNRNNEFVNSATSRNGLLPNLIAETVNNLPESFISNIDTNVYHSWNVMKYNFHRIVNIETSLFAIQPLATTLLKYSKNPLVASLFFSSNSLHHVVGGCAFALSYYYQLNEKVKDTSDWYFIACSTPIKLQKSKTEDDYDLFNFEEYVTELHDSFNKAIPLFDICKAQNNNETVSLPLKDYAATYFPLLYGFADQKFHSSLHRLNDEALLKFLFSILSVSEKSYRIEDGVLTINKPLRVKMVALLNDRTNTYSVASKKIQKWWRNRKLPMVRKLLADLVTRAQSLSRRKLLIRELKLTKDAEVISMKFMGFVITSVQLNKFLNSTTNKTLQLLRPLEKSFHEKEYEYLQNCAAIYIQSVWRGAIQRKRYSLVKKERFEDFSIILLQSSIRRLITTSQVLNTRNTKTLSATIIQSNFRGYLQRKKYKKLLELKLILLPILKKGSKINSLGNQLNFVKLYKQQDSISLQMKRLISVQTNIPPGLIKVQNLVRMHFVRKQYLHLKSCLEKVQALAMTKAARLSYLEKIRSSVKIQRWWRCLPKDSFASINVNPIYYMNMKEQYTLRLLVKELEDLDISLFHFNTYQDIRRIYPSTWSSLPLGLIKNIKHMQKSSSDLNYTQTRKIEHIKFAVGSTHSLMLISTNNGSCVYSWGWNDKGQLGRRNLYPLKTTDSDLLMMEPLEFVDDYKDKLYDGLKMRVNIVEIACGNDFSLALSARGRVFTWGDNTFGQCGQGPRLIRVHDPTPLGLVGVDSVSVASFHAVVSVSGEFFVFGNSFNRKIFRPMNIKSFVPHLQNESIQRVKCSGTTTLVLTNKLPYVLNVFTYLNNFENMYNLMGNVKSFCTNGNMICAIVELSRGENQNPQTKVFLFGKVRCIPPTDKTSLGNKNLFVGAFREKFENMGKHTKHSPLNVHSTPGNICFIQAPTEVAFPNIPLDVCCDHQQLIVTTNKGVYGSKLFKIISDEPSDFEILQNSTLRIKTGSRFTLDPTLYQFTNIKKKRPTIYLPSNSLSHSLGYTF